MASNELTLCELAGALAGYLLVQPVLDERHILQLCVAPPFRRRGIARRLLQPLLAEAEAQHWALLLEVRAGNSAAIALYRNLGFVASGRRKNYYANRGDAGTEDALLMQWQPKQKIQSEQEPHP